MPRLDDKPITAQDIKQYVESQDDFGLELQTFRACRENHFDVSHGGTYEDPVTEKTRQYDLRARKQLTEYQKVQLAIECKSLKPSFPLVISRIPRASNESYHEILCSYERTGGFDMSEASLSHCTGIRVSGDELLYPEREPVGKATVQVGKSPNGEFVSGDAEVFDKWSQAIASATDMIAESDIDYERHAKSFFMTITQPVLVVSDKTLWTVDYDNSGTLVCSPQLANECSVYIGKEYYFKIPSWAYTVSHLRIFTFTAFKKYLSCLAVNPRHWMQLFPYDKINEAVVGRGGGLESNWPHVPPPTCS